MGLTVLIGLKVLVSPARATAVAVATAALRKACVSEWERRTGILFDLQMG